MKLFAYVLLISAIGLAQSKGEQLRWQFTAVHRDLPINEVEPHEGQAGN